MNITAAHNQTLSDFLRDTLNGVHDGRSTSEVVLSVLDEFVANLTEQA